MISYLTGKCAQCKQEKTLPIARDCWLICRECNQMLDESAERGETANCFYCRYTFSRLWGEFNKTGNFICRECLPEGVCIGCGELKRISFLSRNLCAECRTDKKLIEEFEN